MQKWKVPAYLLLAILLIGAPPKALSEEAITAATPIIITDLKESAAKDRAFAAEEQKRADAWRELADKARQNAAGYDDPALKKTWEDSARQHDERAAALDADIAKLKTQADEKEARASRLQAASDLKNQPPVTPAAATPAGSPGSAGSGNAPPKPKEVEYQIDVEDTIGVWRPVSDGDWPFVIVPQDPESKAYRHKLEAHSNERVWKGMYYSFPDGHPTKGGEKGRVVLHYKPRAEEMNPDIPEWARKALQDKLDWRIELSESKQGSIVDPRFTMKWYPGEVKWRDGDQKSAEIIGEGKPHEIEIALETAVEVEQLAAPSLWLEAVDAKPSDLPEAIHLSQVMKHQPFQIKVRLPKPIAEKAGENITVTIKDLKGGGSTSISLQGPKATALHRPVIYRHDGPITIADPGSEPDRSPKLMSIGWIISQYARSDETGHRIDLWAKDGAQIEFRYGDTYQQISLYENWMTEQLAAHWDKAMLLRDIFNKMILDPTVARNAKEEVHFQQRVLNNYFALRTRDDLLDQHKYYLGQLYLGGGILGANLSCSGQDCGISPFSSPIVYIPGPQLDSMLRSVRSRPSDPKYFTTLVKGFVEAIKGEKLVSAAERTSNAVPWTSVAERSLVADTLAAASDEVAGQFQSTVGDTVLAVPMGLTNEISIILTSKDLYGKRYSDLDRQLTASRFIAQLLLSQLQGAAISGVFKMRGNALRKIGTPSYARSTIKIRGGASKAAAIQQEGFVSSADDIPRTVGKDQLAETALRLDANPDMEGGPACGRIGGKGKGKGSINLRDSGEFIIDGAEIAAERVAQSLYGKNIEVVGEQVQPPQIGGTCVAATVNNMVADGTGAAAGETGVLIRATERVKDVTHNRMMKANMRDRILNSEYARFHGKSPTDILQDMVEDGVPLSVARDILREKGADVGMVPPARNARTNLRHVKAALDRDYQVFMAIDLSENLGPGSYHAIRVTKLVTDGSGQIVKVRFFEPNLGRQVQLPLAEFERLIARTAPDGSQLPYGNMMVVKWDGRPWQSTGAKVAPKPPSAPPPAPPKPTIEYPKPKTP